MLICKNIQVSSCSGSHGATGSCGVRHNRRRLPRVLQRSIGVHGEENEAVRARVLVPFSQ